MISYTITQCTQATLPGFILGSSCVCINFPRKGDLIKAELAFLAHDQDLLSSDILKDILNELRDNVIPLFKRKSNYDIIGKFYEEFLRYAGVANVKKGIVLTPRHITTLFTDLVDLRLNDVFLDPACGTGAFLIAAMNKLIEMINQSELPNKDVRISEIKKYQLIGFEKNATMYSLAISNKGATFAKTQKVTPLT